MWKTTKLGIFVKLIKIYPESKKVVGFLKTHLVWNKSSFSVISSASSLNCTSVFLYVSNGYVKLIKTGMLKGI